MVSRSGPETSALDCWSIDPARPENWRRLPPGQFSDWKRESHSFEVVGAGRNRSFTLTSFDNPETPLAREVSDGYFETLGVQPALGSLFRPEEDRPGAAAGERVWNNWRQPRPQEPFLKPLSTSRSCRAAPDSSSNGIPRVAATRSVKISPKGPA